MWNKRRKITAGVFLSAALLCGAYLGWCCALKDNVIWSDHTINGVSIRGMTRKEAEEAIEAQFQEDYEEAQMTLCIAEEEYSFPVYPFLKIDVQKEIQNAYCLGHGKWYRRGYEKLAVLPGEEPVSLEILPETKKEEGIFEALMDTKIQKVNTLEETKVEVRDDCLVIQKGSWGVKADMKELEEEVRKAFADKDYQREIQCPVHIQEPKEVDLDPYFRDIYQLKKAAMVDPKQNYRVIPSRDGISFDVIKAEKALREAEEGETITIDFKIEKPSITTEEMEERLFRDELASFTTYGGGTASRITNLTLAAQACDDVVLMPGEIFSYNETVGERTAERGFKSAVVYANGVATQGIGGGICQVSSTLFAAVLHTDLEILERRNHSLTVAYLPMGMDAMVSWGTQDFRFQNTTDYPVRIKMVYHDGQVDAVLMGTKLDESRIEVDTEQTGGLSAKTYRKYYDGDGELLETEEVAVSTYRGGH